MSHLLKKYRGKIQLIAVDPPFDSKADYKKKIELKGKSITNDSTSFEEKQYTDIWSNDLYLQFMYERLILMRELLSDTGSIYVHCDWRVNSYMRLLLDEIFGVEKYKNEITWKRHPPTGAKATSKQYARNTDNLLYYTKSHNYIWNNAYKPYSKDFIETYFRKDSKGRLFRDSDLGMYSEKSIKKFEDMGKIYITKNGGKRLIRYLDEEKGEAVSTIWDDISEVNSMANDRLNYPTQKPEPLFERIIKASSNPGDLVMDCFMGSGTTQAVAMKLGRRFIGADINMGAIQITTKRLIGIAQELEKNPSLPTTETNDSVDENPEGEDEEGSTLKEQTPQVYYTGFKVFNVNDYDLFRNPIQAKDLIKETMEISSLDKNHVFDGMKDGYYVKIMPVNRIASKEDLNEIVSGVDLKSWELENKKEPGKVVAKIMLICMGHDPDLGAELQKNLKPYTVEVKVVDILRDRNDLIFRREPSAKISITKKGNKKILKVSKFYPYNLMQKLSLQETNVKEWKELVESIFIDSNYDGSVLSPTILDIPEKSEQVKGEYEIPQDHGTIRIKITDLLSESYEATIEGDE